MAQYQDYIMQWLGGAVSPPGQEPLRLSNDIRSFEADFSSGFLIGQILTHYGVCESITTFNKKNNKESRVHNFYQIEDALRTLKVQFDAKLIHKVMSEEPGASMQLLNLLRRGIDNHFTVNDKTVTNLRQRVVDSKVKYTKDLALKLPQIHKDYGVDGPSINSKHYQIVENKLLKFEVARENFSKRARDDEQAEISMLQSMQQSKRQEALQKMQENKEFMNDWNKTGRQNWKTNQNKRAAEISRVKHFEDREIKIYKDQLNRELNYNTGDMQMGITEFHENLRKLGVEENIDIQEAIKRQEQKKGIPPGQIQNFSYAATINKIKDTKINNEFAGKERERRNRKLKVDQQKIQEMLDSQKKEQEILSKLLARQNDEQKEAFNRQRAAQCKAITLENRVKKASEFRAQRDNDTAQIEQEMREEAEAIEPERVMKHDENKREIKGIRRDDKYKKRRVNIEIASEVIDLMMDLAETAFEHTIETKEVDGGLIDKPTWRDWMSMFVDGKKCSEANLVIQKQETLETDESEKNPLAKMLGAGVDKISPTVILDKMKNEGVFTDFLQYLTVSGTMNMSQFANDRWNNIHSIVQADPLINEKGLNFSFLNNENIPQNTELAKLIEKLYSQHGEKVDTVGDFPHQSSIQLTAYSSVMRTSGLAQINEHAEEIKQKQATATENSGAIPTWHTIKLCVIGKASSGKNTTAQQIKDNLGDKISLFNMNEVLREALTYVHQPEKKEEVAEVVDKKGKPQKTSKKDEPAIVDQFAGLNTTSYKQIASHLLTDIKVQTGQDKVPAKSVDLVSLIKDDNLLINLFIQKLKLTYHQAPPSEEERDQTMRENLQKEKELRAQLQEAISNEASVENLNVKETKAKGKGTAKKDNVKSTKDIREEITQLLAVQKDGWILVDFPRNINQAKLIENHFNGYRSQTDQPKSYTQVNFEVWSNFTDPEVENKELTFDAQNSIFDSVILMNTERAECVRRFLGRKIDPQTQTIYHMEDSPPPASDSKLLDRLIKTYGAFEQESDIIAFHDHNHLMSSDNEPLIQKFYSDFGIMDQKSGFGVSSFVQIDIEEKQEKQEIYKQLESHLDQILNYKQILWDRQHQTLRVKIQQEEAEVAIREADQQEGEQPEAVDQKTVTIEDAEMDGAIQQTSVYDENDTQLKMAASRFSEGDHTSEMHSKKSKSTSMKQRKKKEYSRDFKIQLWEEMCSSYLRDGMLTINAIKKLNESTVNSLNQCQNDFIAFLERNDEKQMLITEFVANFNQFSSEFPDLRQDDQTKEELTQRVEMLSNNLWKSIINKKDESIQEIHRQEQEGWAVQEMRNVCKLIAQMVEIEIKKFNAIFQIAIEGEPPVELDAEIYTKKIIERGAEPYNKETRKSSILDQVVAKMLHSLDELFIQAQRDYGVSTHPLLVMLNDEKSILIYRITMLQAWGLTQLEDISLYSQEVYSLMDDWVIEAVSQENSNTQVVLNAITDFIRSNEMMMNEYDFNIVQTNLQGIIQTKNFFLGAQPVYVQNYQAPSYKIEDKRFGLDQLDCLFDQIRKVTGEKGNSSMLDQQTFINIMTLLLRQRRIPNQWKTLNFDKIQNIVYRFKEVPLPGLTIGDNSPTQFQSEFTKSMGKSFSQNNNRAWMNWKKAFIHFALLNSEVPSQETIEQYEAALKEAAIDRKLLSCDQFLKVPAWFDKTEGRPGANILAGWLEEHREQQKETEYEDEVVSEEQVHARLDEQRLERIKQLLFNTFRDQVGQDKLNIPEFVNTLLEISQFHQEKTFMEALFD